MSCVTILAKNWKKFEIFNGKGSFPGKLCFAGKKIFIFVSKLIEIKSLKLHWVSLNILELIDSLNLFNNQSLFMLKIFLITILSIVILYIKF